MQSSNNTSVFRICFTTFSIALLAYLIQYALKVFIARHTTPALYGDYAIALRVLNMSAIIALLGTNTSSTRFLSSFLKNKHSKLAAAYISWNIHFISRSFILCFMLAMLSALGAMALHHLHIKHIGAHHMAIYMLWVAPFLSLALLLGNYLLCKRATLLSSILTQFTLYSILLLLIGLGVLWLNITLGTANISWIIFTAVAILLGISFVASLHHFPGLFSLIKTGITTKHQNTDWEKSATTLTLNNVMYQLIIAMNLFIIEAVVHNEHSVGHFAVASTIAAFIFLLPTSIFRYLSPTVSTGLKTAESKAALQKQWTLTSHLNIMACFLVAAVVVFFGKLILGHFGPTYPQAYPITLVLLLGYIVGAIFRPACTILAFSGHEKYLLQTSAVELVLLLTAGTYCTHVYGTIGMAWVTTASISYKAIYTSWRCRRDVQFNATGIL